MCVGQGALTNALPVEFIAVAVMAVLVIPGCLNPLDYVIDACCNSAQNSHAGATIQASRRVLQHYCSTNSGGGGSDFGNGLPHVLAQRSRHVSCRFPYSESGCKPIARLETQLQTATMILRHRAPDKPETTKTESMEPEKIVQILDELAEQSRSDEATYRQAAVAADEPALIAFSLSCAAVCSERADELESISILYRAGPKHFRRYFPPLDQAWHWLATCWRRREDMEIVAVCQRRTDKSLRVHERVLGLPLPVNLRIALQNHVASVKQRQAGFRRLHHQLWQRADKGKPVATRADFHASGT